MTLWDGGMIFKNVYVLNVLLAGQRLIILGQNFPCFWLHETLRRILPGTCKTSHFCAGNKFKVVLSFVVKECHTIRLFIVSRHTEWNYLRKKSKKKD